MKPARCPAAPLAHPAPFIAALLVFLVTGCGVTFRSTPALLNLPTGAALEEHLDQSRAWWDARFRFFWPEGENPRWHLDLLVADRLVKPVLIGHRDEIALWRIHRRAARDGAGHQFSFLFYADRESARRILADLRQPPLLEELQDAGMLESVVFDDPDGNPKTGPGAAGDPNWSGELRTAWPYYIMGVSAMWLELIHQVSAEIEPPEDSPEELAQYYRELDQRVDRIWEDEAQHALLHHLNAVFEYRPLMIQKRIRF